MKSINDIQQAKLRRRIHDAMQDVDVLKAQLAQIRDCCAELEHAMRDIRRRGQQAQIESKRKQIKRVV